MIGMGVHHWGAAPARLARGVLRAVAALAGLAGLAVSVAAAAPPVVELDADERVWPVGARMEIAAGVDPGLPVEDILSGATEEAFSLSGRDAPLVRGEGDVWLRFRARNAMTSAADPILLLRFPYLEDVAVFTRAPDGGIETARRGAAVPYGEDTIASHTPAFNLDIPRGETRDVYVRVRSDTVRILPVEILRADAFQRRIMNEALFFALIMGAMLAVAIYALSVYAASRSKQLLSFADFAVSSTVYVGFASGLGKAMLLAHLPLNANTLMYAAQGLSIAFAARFLSEFLNLKERAPALARVAQGVMVAGALATVAAAFPNMLAKPVFLAAFALGPTLLLGITLWLWRSGASGAGFAAAGWTITELSVVWLYLRLFDLTPYLSFNHMIAPLACCLTVLQFSWALARRAREAERIALHDPLTGLPNRRYLEQTIEAWRVRPDIDDVAVVQFDLDKFKHVNDTHGHEAGDHVLKIAGAILRANTRDTDFVSRVGGDEFVLLMACAKGDTAIPRLVSERIVAALSEPFAWRGEKTTLRIGASAGIALASEAGSVVEALRQADGALYDAKRAGRGRVVEMDAYKTGDRRTRPEARTA